MQPKTPTATALPNSCRRFYCSFLLSLIVTFGGSFLAVSNTSGQESLWKARTHGDDWPTFLGPQQNGISTETGIRKDWSNSNLPVVWKIETGEGYSIGSIAGGRYVHFDRNENSARIRCFLAETGKLLWSYSYESQYADIYGYDSGPRTSPVIDQDRVFTLGVEGQLTCLGLSDGAKIWSVNTSEKFGVIQNFFGVGSTPVVDGDRLLVMIGGSPEKSKEVAPGQLNLVEPNGSAIVAFDKKTGDVLYQLGNDLASYSSIKITDELGDTPVGLAFCRRGLIAFDPEKGKELASFPWRARMLESVNASTPLVVDGKVFISECYRLGSTLLDWKEQKLIPVWSDDKRRDKTLLAHWNTPIIHNGFAYASSGRNVSDSDLRCFELATGTVQWRVKGFARSSITLVDNHLVVMGEQGKLALVRPNPEKFELVSQVNFEKHEALTKLKQPCWSAPVIAHGLMIVRGKHQVICFDLIPEKN